MEGEIWRRTLERSGKIHGQARVDRSGKVDSARVFPTATKPAIKPSPDRFATIDSVLAWVTEVPAATLVGLEVIVLFAGVVSRYAFGMPLIWSDELAGILFIWLSMFGAVVALQRGEHMRLTTVVMWVSPAWRQWLQSIVSVTTIIFFVLLASPTCEYLVDQWDITTSQLRIHDTFRVLPIGLSVVLMLVIETIRLLRNSTARQILGAIVIVALISGALWLARTSLGGIGNYNLVVFFVLLLAVCVGIGLPIAFSFGIATVSYLSLVTSAPLTTVVSSMDGGMSELILLSIPLFVVLGFLMEMMGLAEALIRFMSALVGHVRGGLSYVLIGGMFLVSGISGSKAADMAAIAPVLLPEMKKRGADQDELVALLAATGAMSETIPPSFVLITMGSVTGVSIAALFTAGLLPAVVCTIALACVVFVRSRGESTTGQLDSVEIGRSLVFALPALILPLFIRAAVVEGVATATEVSTLGVVYTLVVGYPIYRRFDVQRIYPILVGTATLSGAILLIIGMATAMAWSLTQSGFSQQLADSMAHMPGGVYGFWAVAIVAFAILGSVLEGIPAVVLFGPLLFPAARALGIHEVHFAVVAILAMGLGLFAPPFGVGFYVACAISRIQPELAARRILPYLGALLVAVVFCAFNPWLSTILLH
jgi:tripartite ATP-independent transporter DctM subunit